MQLKIIIQFINHIISKPTYDEYVINMLYKEKENIYNFCKDNKFKFEGQFDSTLYFSGINKDNKECWLILKSIDDVFLSDGEKKYNDFSNRNLFYSYGKIKYDDFRNRLISIQIYNGNNKPNTAVFFQRAFIKCNGTTKTCTIGDMDLEYKSKPVPQKNPNIAVTSRLPDPEPLSAYKVTDKSKTGCVIFEEIEIKEFFKMKLDLEKKGYGGK